MHTFSFTWRAGTVSSGWIRGAWNSELATTPPGRTRGAVCDAAARIAHQAHVDDFVQEKKEGYETIVGDGGSNLSGGQKQRVTIARAILRNAPILLLDEATSALDTETERIIQDAIHILSKGKTVIAIAHRLSTILEADQIIVMENGKVHSAGTHKELLEKSDLYQRLYHLQFETAEDRAAQTAQVG